MKENLQDLSAENIFEKFQNIEKNNIKQLAFKPQLQADHCLTTWLHFKYGTSWFAIRKGADLEKQNCLFGLQPLKMGK